MIYTAEIWSLDQCTDMSASRRSKLVEKHMLKSQCLLVGLGLPSEGKPGMLGKS